MEKFHQPSTAPASYPKGGKFGDLLKWHLAWGTCPYCSTEIRNAPWVKSKFAQLVHEDGLDPKSAARSLRNWTNHGKLPEEQDKEKVDRVFCELFGEDPNLIPWKKDLERALDEGRKLQTARIAKRDIAPLISTIPLPTPYFLGREAEVKALSVSLLSPNGFGAVLVQGGPGIGKTELTKAIAHHPDIVKRFGERRWFIRLENARNAKEMKRTIAWSIGCDPTDDFEKAISILRERPSLLILDNLETPQADVHGHQPMEDALAELSAVPNVAMLASFRGTNFVGGTRWHFHSLRELGAEDATDLFVSIAGQWAHKDRNLEGFIKVLGGLPLAIDLLARRAHGHTSLDALWHEWLRVGTMLANRPHDNISSTTSLPYSIEISVSALKKRDHSLRLFKLLGETPNGMRECDVEKILGDETFLAIEDLIHSGMCLNFNNRFSLFPSILDYANIH